MDAASEAPEGPSRRRFLTYAALAGASAWVPIHRIPAASADDCAPPPGFPNGIELFRQAFENWAKEIVVDDVWTCVPRNGHDVVALANWAREAGFQLRARGRMHTWAPLTVVPGTTCRSDIVLLDTIPHFGSTCIVSYGGVDAVRAQTGVVLDDLLRFVEERGFGIAGTPAIGELTLGGVLAVDGHGSSAPADGETLEPGHTFGSLSNLILEMTVIAWDGERGTYREMTFDRTDPRLRALTVHLGRAFVTEVVLQLGPRQTMRCQSFTNVPMEELCAAPGSGGRTYESYLRRSGRAEIILFPFTDFPWLKVWTLSPRRPLLSRRVTGPCNYVFSDNLPEEVTDLIHQIITGNTSVTPLFGQAMYAVATAGLLATAAADIWGSGRCVQTYIKATTVRASENGYVLLTDRDNVQRAIHEFYEQFRDLVADFRARGLYPANVALEIRCSGLDHESDVAADGAVATALSAAAPRPDRPEWNTAIWINVLSMVGTPGQLSFYERLETWMYEHFDDTYACVRPEWSKGWAFSADGAWTNPDVLAGSIPEAFSVGRPDDLAWHSIIDQLDALDPHRVFSNQFLDTFART